MGKLTFAKRWLILGVGVGFIMALGAVLGVGISAMVSAHGGDTGRIHACVNTHTHEVRIVGPDNDCRFFPAGWFPLDWATGWGGAGSGSMYVTNTGDKVGIGTTSPSDKLTVVVPPGGGGVEIVNNNMGGKVAYDPGINVLDIKTTPSSNTPISLSTSGQQRLIVAGNGNIGIGTVSPQAKLDVKGPLSVDDVYIAGKTISTVSGSTSALRLTSDAGFVGVGANLVVSGYTQLDLTSGAPPAADCDAASERGRMKVDSAAGLLYICVDSGWVAK